MAKKNAAKAAKTIGLAELAKIIEKMRLIENAHQVMIWNVLVAHNTFEGVTINASDLLGKAALLTDETPHAAAPPDEAPKANLVQRLLPVFKGSEENVRTFLKTIDGADPTDITRLVNNGVRKGDINPDCKNKNLWQVLHDYDYYTKSLANWNDQIL